MPIRVTAFRPHRTFQAALLASVSALTLLAAGTPAQARNILAGGGGNAAVNAASSAINSAQQAAAATQQARNSLSQATQAIQAMQTAQSAARNLSLQASSTVPSGLAAGGLQVAPGVGSDPTLWQNANLPTQTANNGQTTVTIQQTAQKAILTWQSFNVSKDTTVDFDQSGGNQSNGNNNWIALNRIQDPSGVPSKIFGQIKAEGSVYLINRNGIIFGHSSQVDVHTLVASSLGFLGESLTSDMVPGTAAYDNAVAASNAQFLNTTAGGIAAPESTGSAAGLGGNLVLGVGTQQDSYVPSGAVDIKSGAVIATHANGNVSDGGFVLIAAPTVDNAGTISTSGGQAILAAGIGVSLTQSVVPTQFLLPELTGRISVNGKDATPVGSLINTGLVQATTGNVTLLGTDMSLGGVVEVTTSVSVPGSITISTVDEADTRDGLFNSPTGGISQDRRAGQLILTGVLANLPEENGQSVPSDGGSFKAGALSLTGGSIWLQDGSLIEAPGAKVGITALVPGGGVALTPPGDTPVQGRIYVDNGATVDVAGLSDVELPISDVLFTIPVIGGNELANSPLQRNGFLLGKKNLVLDSTLSGTTADGLAWVGSPLLNASGYADLIPRGIDQLLTNGGSITLSGNQVMTAGGSSLNLDGGYVHYLGGVINTTRLMDASGHIVDIGHADPNDIYIGIAGQFTVDHSHWGAGVSTTFSSALLTGGAYQSDFIVGGNAGTLNVFGNQAVVLDGAMSAQAIPGIKQIQAGLAPSGTSPGGNFLPEGGSFNLGASSSAAFPIGNSPGGQTNGVMIQDQPPQLGDLSPGFGAATPLDVNALNALGPDDPNNILAWTTVPADAIGKGGFANVTVTLAQFGSSGEIVVARGSSLKVQPGGSITLNDPGLDISVLGDLIAPSGVISLSTNHGSITVGPDAMISVAGEWVNDDSRDADTNGAATFINGGSISLATGEFGSGINTTGGLDLSGSILLQAGSVIDVSSGGVILPTGQLQMSGGIPVGKGGSLSLTLYNGNGKLFGTGDGAPPLPLTQPTAGRLEMDGTIDSWGFAGGGTLTLQALGFQIGGDPAEAPSWDNDLPTDFFANQGFGSYVLNAMYDATVAPGAIVPVTQRNLIPNLTALAQAPSGADLNQGGLTSLGTLDPFHRQATNLVLTAGAYTSWRTEPAAPPQYAGVTGAVTVGEGAEILADAGAHVGLGSPEQVTVLGAIVAPGGSIVLSADSLNNGYGFSQPGQGTSSQGFTSLGKSVWLGADAVLDVSGVALTDPFAAPVRVGNAFVTPVTGKVLAGGSVVLSDDSGYVVAEAGSVIDVSGASASFDLPQAGAAGSFGGQIYGAQLVWSDAGSITLGSTAGLYFDGTIAAHAGAPQAQGGTLNLVPEVLDIGTQVQVGTDFKDYPGGSVSTKQPDNTSITTPGAAVFILQQDGDLVPAGLAPGQSFGGASTGVLQFSVNRLAGSGIGTLVIGGAIDAGRVEQPVPVAFAGNVSLSLNNAAIINATELVALPAGATTMPTLADGMSSVGAPSVSISAPYVAIVGPGPASASTVVKPITTASLADGTLSIAASFIDIENQISLENFGQATFTSSGDLRLSSNLPGSSGTLAPGLLYTVGNLTFQAADLYPVSGESFILDAAGPKPTTITFLANGASDVPLSAGGTLLVDATNIVQSGTIRAPSGTIVLGIGDATDAATQAMFETSLGLSSPDLLPLANTQSVSLTAGSTTSVSLDGAIVPFGTTVDGTEWQYNSLAGNSSPDLTTPPAKVITVNGANISLDSGATIDLSGGGDLQAVEWIAGTGGSRDVLSQYNVTFPASGLQVAAPLYPDARNVYAILPGYKAPVAAYDPVYAQSLQPAKAANGEASSQMIASGVGQAALGGAVGQAVYLSGVPGLPDGVYTLLPARYATLPGAYRVVQNTGATNVVPGQSGTAPDGTHVVSGYYANALTGARSATPVQFQVQSAATWEQYSQYNLTSANSFDFATAASQVGKPVPLLPRDAGQLVLAATNSLILNTTLKAVAAPGGQGSQVDITSQDIQIVGSGEPALSGYLQISADGLDELGAGSLLIGGTRSQNPTGVTIDALANSVVVSNDATHPLAGPEIILVTKTDPDGIDPNAGNGLRIDGGSVIMASGSLGGGTPLPITIGDVINNVSGDGALLRVSNGGAVAITRANRPANVQGLLTVGAGAVLDGGQSLLLDSAATLSFDPAASFAGTAITVDAGRITFTDGTSTAAAGGFVIGQSGLAQLADATQVALRSYGTIDFVGDVTVTFGKSVDLSAGAFTSDGGTVVLDAGQIAFTNELDAPVPAAAAGAGSLAVNTTEIDFGAGSKTVAGFGAVTMTASGGIVGQDTGTFDFGALPVGLSAPIYLADTSSDVTIETTGALTLNGAPGMALALTPVGGQIGFIGGSLDDNGASIQAPAGNVSLEATVGNLTIAGGSLVSSAGASKQFFDVTEFAPAGNITLTADRGTIDVQSGATLDFSGAQGGGSAGSLTLSAPVQTVNLAGAIKGNAAPGYAGGSLSLDTGGAIDLDSLATVLASSGVDTGITIHTRSGDLDLSAGNRLTAHLVSLTADGGEVTISGTIDANGVGTGAGGAGGEIDLYGKTGVDLEGMLNAVGADAYNADGTPNLASTELGGTVNIGTTGTPNGTYNATYGYENVSTSGAITLGSNAKIDVSGGGILTLFLDGLQGGTVNFRAPLLANGDVNVTIGSGAQITGSRATTLEAYAVWSTTDATTGAQHFDGIVDPAGWYNNNGTLVSGVFANASGTTVASWDGSTLTNVDASSNHLAYYLTNDFFTPNGPYADHTAFYGYAGQTGDGTPIPGTLMGFVEAPSGSTATPQFSFEGRFSGITNFHAVPGIELDNPTPVTGPTSVNGGNISILTNWNLGSGSDQSHLDFRYEGHAPIITFKAENDVKVDASLSDGFFQIANPINPGSSTSVTVPGYMSFADTLSEYYNRQEGGYTGPNYNYNNHKGGSLAYYGAHAKAAYGNVASAPVNVTGTVLVHSGNGETAQQEIDEYLALYQAYADFLLAPFAPGLNLLGPGAINALGIAGRSHSGSAPLKPPSAPSESLQAAEPLSYLAYLLNYQSYLLTNFASFAPLAPPAAPIPELVSVIRDPSTNAIATPGSVLLFAPPAVTDNTPSPLGNSGNPLPIASATLVGGSSSSFRLVAGADAGSANPLALQAAALFANGGGGSVTLDGHFAYVDPNSQTINLPTMVRTGTGSIDVAAANNISLLDTTAPGVIYTAGAPAAGAPPVGTDAVIAKGDPASQAYDLLVTSAVNPDAAGDISIHAGHDITGVENVTGTGNAVSQFWWQWMEVTDKQTFVTNNGSPTVTPLTRTSIDFGAFDQGVMSVGGNVAISAGGDITNLAASVPTTWYLTDNNSVVNTVGGGNLTVTAGGNILSGDYFVARGTGTLTAGGRIGSSGLMFGVPGSSLEVEVSTLLAAQDGVFNLTARQGVDIASVVDPSCVQGSILNNGYSMHADAQSYSAASAVNVISTTGDVDFGTLGGGISLIGGSLPAAGSSSYVLPATVALTAFSGVITVASAEVLYPSATGNLSLIADGSINFVNENGYSAFGMFDVDQSVLPSPLDQEAATLALPTPGHGGVSVHDQNSLHADDTQPVRIYSLTGDIVNGLLETADATTALGRQDVGNYDQLMQISVGKPALIQAGRDIVNLAFLGQNLREDDITRILAGRDIRDSKGIRNLPVNVLPGLLLGGPGTFDVEAGRNIGPLSPSNQTTGSVNGGIIAIGNGSNPFLPHESANVQVLFGIGKGIDDADFIADYIAPGANVPGIDTTPALIAFVEQYDEGQGIDTGLTKDKPQVTLTSAQAWSQFQALPVYVQQLFAEQELFQVLQAVGQDYNDPTSAFFQQYARGYQAINTLFPASLGYTANSLAGGANGASSPVKTGNLDMRSTTIQTQQGGNVTILGPGGQALVGSASAPPVVVDQNGEVTVGPGDAGILTLEQGNVNIFTDQSLLLAQSRIFTEQGGDMVIWSSNGDINAGKGAKTLADTPPPLYVSDDDHYNTLDARGEVTGAGIATLQTIPGAAPGSVFLIAPRGTVDAGDAGIRVSGDLFVAALTVANADNIQVQGTAVGVPHDAAVNIGALTNASNAAGAAANAATDASRTNRSPTTDLPSIITVEVIGYGGGDGAPLLDRQEEQKRQEERRKNSQTQNSYDAHNRYQVIGLGTVSAEEAQQLSDERRTKIGR